MADLDGKVDAIVDWPDCRVGIESTVLDVTGEVPTVLRPGIITPEQIEALLDPLESAVSHLPRLDLTEEQAKLFLNGNPLWSEELPLKECNYAVFGDGGLLGICKGHLISKVLK